MAGNHPIVVIWTAILFHEITCRGVCGIIERFFGCLWSDQPQGEDLKIQDCSNLFGWFYGKTIDLGWLGCLKNTEIRWEKLALRLSVLELVHMWTARTLRADVTDVTSFSQWKSQDPTVFSVIFYGWLDPICGWNVWSPLQIHFIYTNFWSFMDRQFMSIPKIMVLTSWIYVIYRDFTYISHDFNWFHISFRWTLDIEWIESQIYGAVWLRPCP